MRLLVDTDVFCKLASVGLLDAAVSALGGDPSAAERLPALPQMLRKGRLRRELGEELAEQLLKVATKLPEVPSPPSDVAAVLAGRPNIDPGEVQLLAVTAGDAVLLMSGDKRALRALAAESLLIDQLAGKIVCLEALLLALCSRMGEPAVRAAVAPRVSADKVFTVCFSPGNPSAVDCLKSYLAGLQQEVRPLVLWAPEGATR